MINTGETVRSPKEQTFASCQSVKLSGQRTVFRLNSGKSVDAEGATRLKVLETLRLANRES